MECLSQELMKEKYINELLEDRALILVLEARLTDVVLLLTELDILCSTLYLEEHLDLTANSLWSTLHLI